MSTYKKLLVKVLRGTSDANIPFSEICQLLERFGFDKRIKGDHHIFTKYGVEEIFNLQPKKSKAKAYQVKQVRDLILKYKLRLEEENDEKKMMNRYEIIVYWSKEDEAFIAEVPELSGCMADGETYQSAIANAEVIIQEWIETAEELGRPIPQPKGRLVYA